MGLINTAVRRIEKECFHMKKMNRLTAGLLCAVLGAALVMPASAHGHGGGHHRYQPQYVQPAAATVCPYEGCAIAGYHLHDGTAYCGTCYNNYHGNSYGCYGYHYGCR